MLILMKWTVVFATLMIAMKAAPACTTDIQRSASAVQFHSSQFK